MASMLEMFRVLSSFDPPKRPLKDAPWEAFGSWALANGVAPLAAYNLQYRLAGSSAPDEARDRLLSIYQGTANDNVLKLVNFKRSIGELEGRRLVLLSGAAFADSLYPNVAFRPVIDVEVLIRDADVEGFSGFMRKSHFKPLEKEAAVGRADAVLSDTRTEILLHTSLFGGPTSKIDEEVMSRALPMTFYGPSAYRPSHEDAILTVAISHARAGYQVPLLSFIDLRELVLSSPFMGGAYSKPYDAEAVKARAKAWGIERSLYASLAITAGLFPETEAAVSKLKPELKGATRTVIDKVVVTPTLSLSSRAIRGAERVRRWLTAR